MPPKKRAAGGDEGGAKKKINKGHIAALLASLGAAVVWAQFAPGSAKVAPAYISLTTLLCTVIAGATAAGATHLKPTEQAHSDFLTAVQAVAQHNTAAKIFDSPLHAWWDSYKLKRAKNNITAANIAAIDQPIPLSALHQMAKLLADTVFEPFCKLGLNGAPPSEPNEGPGGTTDNPKPSAAKPANPTANPAATTPNATVDISNNTTLAATVINGGAPTGTKPTSSASLAATAAQALATNALHPTNGRSKPDHGILATRTNARPTRCSRPRRAPFRAPHGPFPRPPQLSRLPEGPCLAVGPSRHGACVSGTRAFAQPWGLPLGFANHPPHPTYGSTPSLIPLGRPSLCTQSPRPTAL